MKEICITVKGGNYIQDNNSLEENKNCYQIRKIRALTIRSQSSVSTRREPKIKIRSEKNSSTLTIFLIMLYMKMETSQNG